MRRIRFYFLLAVLIFFGSGGAFAQQVERIEYFFDNDPGYGGGTLVNATVPADAVIENLLIGTGSLSLGFHTLYSRLESSGNVQLSTGLSKKLNTVDSVQVFTDSVSSYQVYVHADTLTFWGIPEQRLVYVDESGDIFDVNVVEYFFDDDPGYGAGTSVGSFTPGENIEFIDSLATGGLSLGFHTLFIRAQITGGRWGVPEQRLVFVDQSGAIKQIQACEYFFDNDPGYGSGTPLGTFALSDTVAFLDSISTVGLALGFHTLYVRVQVDGGSWGIPEQRLIFVDESGDIFDVNTVEYFFDDDPGYGAGTSVGTFIPGENIEFTDSLATGGLSLGFHTLFIRAQITGGRWGVPEQRLVFVDQSGAIKQIQACEYFFDNDPGYGAGTPLGTFTPSDTVSFLDTISTTGLALGFHTLYLRVQVDGGSWGIPEQRLIFADESGDIFDVSTVEYFFDDDPGYGAGSSLGSFTPEENIVFSDSIATIGLSLGFHTLFIRAQITGGRWGVPEQRLVFVDQSGAIKQIQACEYFFDNDPGYGAGTTLGTFALSDTVSFLDSISTVGLALGFHTLYLRVQVDGGSWGIPEQRLIFVDESGDIFDVSSVEYFFDDDPGYGAGTSLGSFTPGENIAFSDSIATGGLSLGFHTLFIRAQITGGRWGVPEQRLVFIDAFGQVFYELVGGEYFFDLDPGYGLATSLDLEADSAILEKILLDASTLPAGEHVVGIRVVDAAGRWSHPETLTFSNFPPSRELDSAALITIYHATGGASSWLNATNWLGSSIDNWYGVILKNGRVDSLILDQNGLSGILPRQVGYIDEMTFLDMSENLLRDTLPTSFQDLQQLTTLHLHENQIHQLPDLSGMTGLSQASLDSNYLDFGDLEQLTFVPNITYSNQKVYDDFEKDSLVTIGQDFQFLKTVQGSNNTYQWYLNDQPVAGANVEDYLLSGFTSADTGDFVLRVNNTVINDLEIRTPRYGLFISDFDEDSLALVSFYEATEGNGWQSASNWLQGPLNSWLGVELENRRVTELRLPSNNLRGNIPANFGYADSLIQLDLSENELGDTLISLTTLQFLNSLNLMNNNYRSIPDLFRSESLDSVWLDGNRLQFGDLERNVTLPNFTYQNQQPFSEFLDTLVETQSSPSLGLSVSGSSNMYQWVKGNEPIAGETNDTLVIEGVVFADEGRYTLQVSNTIVPDLTLISGEINLRVSSLTRDSIVLNSLFNATNREGWTNEFNWSDQPITSWTNIVIENNRVTEIDLPDNNLSDTIPRAILDITSLKSADFSGNNLRSLPRFARLPNLSTLDISGNRMGFTEIERNLGISNFTYDPQQLVGEPFSRKIRTGDPYSLEVNVSGSDNQYSWKLNNEVIQQGSSSEFHLQSIEYDSMGIFTVEITSPVKVPGFSILSENFELLAFTDLIGEVIDLDEQPLSTGGVTTLYTFPVFDSLRSVDLNNSGVFSFDTVVLGDYAMRVTPTDEDLFVSYYDKTNIWTEAKRFELRGQITDPPQIFIAGTFAPPGVEEDVAGLLEADLPDPGGRINARRKVKRAGCSLRKFVVEGGRFLQEFDLEFYTQTDDEGKFVFTDIPDGRYRINIDYPGIPMDPNSYIDFELGPSVGLDKIELSALITPQGIVVEQTNALGYRVLKDYALYPNPTQSILFIDYVLGLGQSGLQLKILNGEGQEMIVQDAPSDLGTNQVEIDISSLAQGVYYLLIQNKNLVIQSKIIKEN